MADQEHDIWFDRTTSYTLSKFHDDMAAKIIWGPSQTLSVWAVDNDSESKWSIRKAKQQDRWCALTVVNMATGNQVGGVL